VRGDLAFIDKRFRATHLATDDFGPTREERRGKIEKRAETVKSEKKKGIKTGTPR